MSSLLQGFYYFYVFTTLKASIASLLQGFYSFTTSRLLCLHYFKASTTSMSSLLQGFAGCLGLHILTATVYYTSTSSISSTLYTSNYVRLGYSSQDPLEPGQSQLDSVRVWLYLARPIRIAGKTAIRAKRPQVNSDTVNYNDDDKVYTNEQFICSFDDELKQTNQQKVRLGYSGQVPVRTRFKMRTKKGILKCTRISPIKVEYGNQKGDPTLNIDIPIKVKYGNQKGDPKLNIDIPIMVKYGNQKGDPKLNIDIPH
ncbi:hypothetical protein Tco_0534023 [Tanacetum coccineum]